MASGRYHLVVLDELTYLPTYRMLDLEAVLQAFSERPSDLHLAVTGRNAPEGLLAAADLVTEMRAVKHYYQAGVGARTGIEK